MVACVAWRFCRAHYWAAKRQKRARTSGKIKKPPPQSPRSSLPLPTFAQLGLFTRPTKTSRFNVYKTRWRVKILTHGYAQNWPLQKIPLHTTMLFVCQAKFWISIIFSFSWGHFNSQEKLKTMLIQNFEVTNKEHYGMLWYFWSGQ